MVGRGLCPLLSPVSESNCQLVTIAHWRGGCASIPVSPVSCFPFFLLSTIDRSISSLLSSNLRHAMNKQAHPLVARSIKNHSCQAKVFYFILFFGSIVDEMEVEFSFLIFKKNLIEIRLNLENVAIS